MRKTTFLTAALLFLPVASVFMHGCDVPEPAAQTASSPVNHNQPNVKYFTGTVRGRSFTDYNNWFLFIALERKDDFVILECGGANASALNSLLRDGDKVKLRATVNQDFRTHLWCSSIDVVSLNDKPVTMEGEKE